MAIRWHFKSIIMVGSSETQEAAAPRDEDALEQLSDDVKLYYDDFGVVYGWCGTRILATIVHMNAVQREDCDHPVGDEVEQQLASYGIDLRDQCPPSL